MANNLIQVRRTSVADREANTDTLPNPGELALNILDGRMFSTNGQTIFEVGANTKNSRVSNSFYVGNGSVNTSANSTQISTSIIQLSTATYIGDNVDLTTTGLMIGNTTVNLVANSVQLTLANSTSNTVITVPNTTAWSGDYFLHANGTWAEVVAGESLLDTVDSNPVGAANGTLYWNSALGKLLINYGDADTAQWVEAGQPGGRGPAANLDSYQTEAGLAANVATLTANNANYLGGTAAADYQTEAGLADNVATMSANNAAYLGGTAAASYALDTDLDAYQTEAGLSDNVATLTANNSTNFAGQGQSYYANVTSPVFSTSVNVGANVQANTTALLLGNSSVNIVANSTTIKLANSTSNTIITVPSTTAWNGEYYLHANGTWAEVPGADPGGSNTYVQYNDSTAWGGSAGFTFNKDTNTVTIANTLIINHPGDTESAFLVNASAISNKAAFQLSIPTTGEQKAFVINRINESWGFVSFEGNLNMSSVGPGLALGPGSGDRDTFVWRPSAGILQTNSTINISGNTINSTVWTGKSYTANDSTNLGGTAATSYQLNSTLADNVATMSANNAAYLGGTAAASYALDTDLDAYQTEAGLSDNVATLTANNSTNFAGQGQSYYANVTSPVFSTSVNSAAIYVTNQINAASYNSGTGFVANTLGVYANSVVNAAAHTGTGFTANSLGVYANSVVNAASHTGTGFTANSLGVYANSVVNAASHTSTNFVANTTGVYHTLMNAATFSVGSLFTANSILVNCAAINMSGQINVGANSIISNSVISSGGSLLSANVQTNPQTDTYSLVASDSGKVIPFNNASAKVITVPASLPVGFRCQIIRIGAGTVTLSNTGSTGLSIQSRTGAFAITAQYGSASVFMSNSTLAIIDGSI